MARLDENRNKLGLDSKATRFTEESFEEICLKPKIPLWRHQKEAVWRSRTLPNYALFFDPGTGKTATTINILRNKYADAKGLFTTLILCPPVVVENWKREILAHSNIPEKNIVCLQGSGAERAKMIEKAGEKVIFITNYEALLMPLVFVKLHDIFSRNSLSALVLDEAHKCKESTAKRTKKAIELADRARFRFILTGTPILNKLMDIYAQFRILDRGDTFGNNYFSFRARYFYDKNKNMPKQSYFPDWRPLPKAEQEIQDNLQALSMLAKKEDCIDLPPLVRKVINVPLAPEQKRLYKAMKDDLIATFEDDSGRTRASIAELAITKALRLQQIVSGHIRVETESGPTETIRLKENPRKDAVRQILEDVAPFNKVLIWAVFKDNYADLREVCESLGLPFVEVHGEIKDKQREVDAFNNDPAIRVLIGHPKSGGIGVNMIAASYSIFYTRSFSREDDVQAEARNYRAGSIVHEKVTRVDLVAPGTIDELIVKAIADKTELSAKILKERIEEI